MKDFWYFFLESPWHVVATVFGVGLLTLACILGPHPVVLTILTLATAGIVGTRYTEFKRRNIE